MRERDSQIERLDALLASGAITEAEHATQLKGLPLEMVLPDQNPTLNLARKYRWLFLPLIVALLAGSAFFLGKHDGTADATKESSIIAGDTTTLRTEQVQPDAPARNDDWPVSPRWVFRTTNDPLTDLQNSAAFSRIPADPFSIKVMIACKGNKELGYQLLAYGQDDEAVPLRTTLTGSVSMHESARFTLRFDKAEPVSVVDDDLRFSNAVTFKTGQGSTLNESWAAQAARAQRIVAQLPLESGDATIVIDQQDPELRALLDQCLSGASANAKAQIRRKKAECEAGNSALRERVIASRSAYKARGEQIPSYLGDEGAPIKVDQYGNGLHDCGET